MMLKTQNASNKWPILSAFLIFLLNLWWYWRCQVGIQDRRKCGDRGEKKQKHTKQNHNRQHNLSPDRQIDSYSNPLTAAADVKLAAEPRHGHSSAETFAGWGWSSTWRSPCDAERGSKSGKHQQGGGTSSPRVCGQWSTEIELRASWKSSFYPHPSPPPKTVKRWNLTVFLWEVNFKVSSQEISLGDSQDKEGRQTWGMIVIAHLEADYHLFSSVLNYI